MADLGNTEIDDKLVKGTGGTVPQTSDTPFPVPDDFEAMAKEITEIVAGGSEDRTRITENKGPLAKFQERVRRIAKRRT